MVERPTLNRSTVVRYHPPPEHLGAPPPYPSRQPLSSATPAAGRGFAKFRYGGGNLVFIGGFRKGTTMDEANSVAN